MKAASVRRALPVILGVIAVSAFAGAIAGGLVTFVLDILIFARPSIDSLDVYGYGAAIGATLGAVLGPTAAFGFLRRTPIWRVFAETATGAVVGGVLGFLFRLVYPTRDGVATVIAASVVGFIAATARLWWTSRRARESESLSVAG